MHGRMGMSLTIPARGVLFYQLCGGDILAALHRRTALPGTEVTGTVIEMRASNNTGGTGRGRGRLDQEGGNIKLDHLTDDPAHDLGQ